MLEVDAINTYYGKSHILHDVSFEADNDEVVALLGRNGVGKTTTMKSIIGLTPPRTGTVRFEDEVISGNSASEIANRGIGYVPQDRGMFPDLTVEENLTMGLGTATRDQSILDQIYERFPRVEERLQQKAGTLSGGEQQMVAMARALMRDPKLVLMDEPTEGLMPSLIPEIADITEEIADSGYTIVIVEQNVDLVMDIADRVYLMDNGRIHEQATPAELRENEAILEKYLGVGI
ncbi:ABC transporter ATP-binding protein [Natronomonas gomsonensis]|jgi:branched-chain amino acid transport system ATP-binding protein|uniref:ABC transporter ATP-binding protein n=1 Tax=Natronomonas gomsonensis TaxID=1046043 RepID=UPI0020CA6568|nr:ABC transporter ATP-binding protein [Natronomonas gomsonensis]